MVTAEKNLVDLLSIRHRLHHAFLCRLSGLLIALLFPNISFANDNQKPLVEINQFPGIKINAPTAPSEANSVKFSIVSHDRRVREGLNGYSPAVQGYPSRWSDRPQITWDFGDGSPPLTVQGEMSVSHQYSDEGTYTITAKIGDRLGVYSTATHQLTVKNRDPSRTTLGVIAGENSGEMILSAWAKDVKQDVLTYVWDFGDGATLEGIGMWRVSHQYIEAGSYDVKLRVVDGDGGEDSKELTVKVSDGNRGSASSQLIDDFSEEPISVLNGLEAEISGDFNFSTEAKIGSVGGVHLSPIKSGACRFMFTAWDESNLAHGFFLLDFPGLPEEGGKFRFNSPRVVWSLEPNRKAFDLQKGSHGGDIGALLGSMSGRTDRANIDSPYGIETSVAYTNVSGVAEIDFVPYKHIKGRYNAVLESKDEDWGAIRFEGQFSLNLTPKNQENTVSDLVPSGLFNSSGLLNYEGCRELAPLQIRSTYPDNNEQHQREHIPIRVSFDQRVQPESVNDETLQLGYLNQAGEFKKLVGRILHSERKVWFAPDTPLQGGVTHEIRVKAGEEGVKGVSGSILEMSDKNSDWVSTKFTTKVDFVAKENAGNLLSCNLYQTVRDAPLIVGKKAVAQVSANWSYYPDVLDASQVKAFDARVVLLSPNGKEINSEWFRFVRPNPTLPQRSNPDTSAWIEIPQVMEWEPSTSLRLHLQVREKSGSKITTKYTTRCPMRIWSQAPSLTVQLFALRMAEWEDREVFQAIVPTLHRLGREVEQHAWQLLPVKDIVVSDTIQPLSPSLFEQFDTYRQARKAQASDSEIFKAFIQSTIPVMKEKSNADILVLLTPHGIVTTGGTYEKLVAGQGVVSMFVSDDPALFPRYVNGTVHEFGHALNLEHIPFVISNEDRSKVINAMADEINGVKGAWFQGIGGLRMNRDGTGQWLKSSTLGNAQQESLVPLMFPRTVHTDIGFTAHHQYREMQRYLEKLSR